MGDAHDDIVDRFGRDGGELRVGGVRLREIADTVGTPLFVYDREAILATVARLRRALPDRFDLYYSIKANPSRAILETFLDVGCGLEVASGGELHQALAAGCAAGRILFAGPGKTVEELDQAVRAGIGEIHAESCEEIDALAEIARRRGVEAHVALRINPSGEAQGGAMRMGGKPSPFGIDEERLDAALDRVSSRDSLVFAGIHLFTGTQILDAEVLVRQYAHGLGIARRAAQRTGMPVRTVDFGGGLGIPYYRGETDLDLEAFGSGVARLVADLADAPEFAGTRFLVEPGRYLVGPCGVYVARVTYVKESRGKRFVITDGGMHHHLAASGNLGQVIKRNYPVAAVTRLGAPTAGTADVVGPLCTPLDVLARNIEFPEVAVGDLVGVFQSGAYARSASPNGFLSHPAPPEVLVSGGHATTIRERQRYEEMLAGQS